MAVGPAATRARPLARAAPGAEVLTSVTAGCAARAAAAASSSSLITSCRLPPTACAPMTASVTVFVTLEGVRQGVVGWRACSWYDFTARLNHASDAATCNTEACTASCVCATCRLEGPLACWPTSTVAMIALYNSRRGRMRLHVLYKKENGTIRLNWGSIPACTEK